MTIDLAKCMRRDGITIENPECLLLESESGGQELLYTINSLTFAQTIRIGGLREA